MRDYLLLILISFIPQYVSAEIVEIHASGNGGASSNTTFDGFTFQAVIENMNTPEKARLLKFGAGYRRPRGQWRSDFSLDEYDIQRFSSGYIRHPSTGRPMPALIITIFRQSIGEAPSVHPRTGGNISNLLIARILIYPTLDEVRFIENIDEGNDFDNATTLHKRSTPFKAADASEIFTATELQAEDPLKVPICKEWTEWIGKDQVKRMKTF